MIQPPKQKLLQNCTPEERNQFMVDAIFLLAHTQLQVEFLDNIKNETQKVMENVSAILKEAGMDLTQVVKTTIFMKNMDDFAAMNEVYGSFFTGNFPARETVQVVRLPLDVNVEISVIAVG